MNPAPQPSPLSANGDTDPRLDRLRELIHGASTAELEELRRRLDESEVRAAEISRILPDSIRRALEDEPELVLQARPLIERAMRNSVDSDPRITAEILHPIIGPAIWKAVSSAINNSIQRLNVTIERSFTLRGLSWRIESWRTGRPIGEIALRHSLRTSVEQVFLIHSETGILLEHVGSEDAGSERESISAMLTAIQDFVRDAFAPDSDSDLQTMRVGDLAVWIEQGPRAYLAAVVAGAPPSARLRLTLGACLSDIHRMMRDELAEFSGEVEAFSQTRPLLETCLVDEEAERPKKRPWPLIAAAGAAAVLLLVWLGLDWRERVRGRELTAQLRAEPGITVVESVRSAGVLHLSLLADPDAMAPESLLEASPLTGDDVSIASDPYISLDPEMTVRRARARLAPPDSVTLAVQEGVLVASGTAPTVWVARFRAQAGSIPGVSSWNGDQLTDSDVEELRERIDRAAVTFPLGRATSDGVGIDSLADDISSLTEAGTWKVEIFGATDPSGSTELNRGLRQRRAEWVRARLIERGVPAAALADGQSDPRQDSKPAVFFRVSE